MQRLSLYIRNTLRRTARAQFDTEDEESEKGLPNDMAHGVEIKVSD